MYPNHRGLESRWVALAALLLAPPAWAHDADVIYVLLTDAPGGDLEEVVTLTAGTLSQLAPVDENRDGALSQADLDARGDAIKAGVWEQMPLEADARCLRSQERARLRDGYVELAARFGCPRGPLSQDFRILTVLTTNYRVVLGRQLDGDSGRAFAQGNVQRLLIRPTPQGRGTVEPGFVGGLVSPLSSGGVTLVWLLSLLLATSLRAMGGRTLVVLLGHALASVGAAGTGWSPPPLVAEAVLALAGAALTLGVLARDPSTPLGTGVERWPLWGLGLLCVAEGVAGAGELGGAMGSLRFQAGRLCGIGAIALVAVPLARQIGRRPGLKRKAAIALGCLALCAFGVSLIQTARAF